jgi:putative zinc finger/helix-turn-helix YgiT family protein
MKNKTRFGYACPECGKGTVQATKIQNYKTRIKGYPFVVDEAVIGICDNCDARHFSAQETKRWEDLYFRTLEEQNVFLKPEEIAKLRKQLGLSMEDFARLTGCTRQSIYNWEKADRKIQPSRMADLLMKLVRESFQQDNIDAISFLLKEAKLLGMTIELKRNSPLIKT